MKRSNANCVKPVSLVQNSFHGNVLHVKPYRYTSHCYQAMKVCFDVSAALGQGAGVSRYIRELLAAMLTIEDAPALTLFSNRRLNQTLDALPEPARHTPRIEVPLSDKLWRMRLLSSAGVPQLASFATNFDLFHGTDVIAPQVPAPIVVTVHDMTTWLFPQFHARANRWYQRLTLPFSCAEPRKLLPTRVQPRTTSWNRQATPAEKITVAHLGVDHSKFNARPVAEAAQRIASQLNITSPFFLGSGHY